MKGFILTAIFIITVTLANSQELSHQVLVPAAMVTSGIPSCQHTVGEAAVEIFGTTEYITTQGFQQPSFTPLFNLEEKEGNGVVFFPNPVTRDTYYIMCIQLYGSVSRTYNVIMVNFMGSVVYTNKISLETEHNFGLFVDMSQLSNGIYLIRVTSTDGLINRSFKIDKL